MLTPGMQFPLRRKQRGSLTAILIYGGIIAVGVAGIGFVVYSYNKAIAEVETLRTQNASLQSNLQDQLAENDRLAKDNKRINTILVARQEARVTQQDIERVINGALQKTFANDQKAKDWASVLIPESIITSLRSTDNNPQPDNNKKAIPARTAIVNTKGTILDRARIDN